MSALLTLRRSPRRQVRVHGVPVLVAPIPDDPHGVVAQLHSDAEISTDFFAALRRDLAARGYRRIRTNAIGERYSVAAHSAGFVTAQHLVLLERPREALPPVVANITIRATTHHPASARSRHVLDSCASIDAVCFPATWSLDAAALRDAVSATPRHRLFVAIERVAVEPVVNNPAAMAAPIVATGRKTAYIEQPIGYLLCGADASHGFVQRLAVIPERRCSGVARVMLGCAIEWLQAAGVQSTWVNTEPDNAAALSLYARAGFRRQPAGLVVVEWNAP